MIQLLINFYRVRNIAKKRPEGKRNKISRVALVALLLLRVQTADVSTGTYRYIRVQILIYIRNARVNHLTFYRLNFVALVSRLAVGYTCAIFTSGNPRQPSLRNLREPSMPRWRTRFALFTRN